MRGVYIFSIKISALAAAKTAILLEAASNKSFEILDAKITNASGETLEMLEFAVSRVTTKGSPAGTSITPQKADPNDGSSSITALGNLTTEPTTYDSSHLDYEGAANTAGYRYQPLPELRPSVNGAGLVGLRILTSTFTALDIIALIAVRET